MAKSQKPNQSSSVSKSYDSKEILLQSTNHQPRIFHILKSLDSYLNQFVQPFTPFLDKLVAPLDPLLAKLTIYGLLISSISLTIILTENLIDRYIWIHQLTLAAGKEDGESYKLSKAFKTVVERHYWNIKINLEKTGGTQDNLEHLKTKDADLATAQADVVAEKNDQSIRTVALLYRDYFQLIVNKKAFDIQTKDSPEEAFLKFIRKLHDHANGKKSIEVPDQGGQRISFNNIAKHYGLKEGEDFIFTEIKDQDFKQEEKEALKQGTISAIFRVRALGNHDISEILREDDMKLLPIEQAAAMSAEHPSLQSNNVEIPIGTYQGDPAIPSQKLQTIAVQRLLLARADLPERLVQEITEVLNDYPKEIAVVAQENGDVEVKPLTTSISEPDTTSSAGVPLHPGARNFYKRQDSHFIEQYLNIIALIISIGSFSASILWKLNIRLKKERKDRADQHIAKAVALMKPEIELNKLFVSQRQLEQIFYEASNDLRSEKISQESFRTFNEAYKTSREFIERTIEGRQRQISAKYIKQVMELLEKQEESADVLLKELDGIFMQAKQLIQENIFSRESFRTFIESYNVVRDTLQRKKEEFANQISVSI